MMDGSMWMMGGVALIWASEKIPDPQVRFCRYAIMKVWVLQTAAPRHIAAVC